MASPYDIVVVGGGFAGSSAALYAARAGRKALLLDRGIAHSTIGRMTAVLDLPGFSERLSGEALIKRIRWQAKDTGAEFRDGEVRAIQSTDQLHTVIVGDNRKFETRTVILATGCGFPSPTFLGESEFVGKGICYHLPRDLGAARKRSVAVIGKSLEIAEAVRAIARVAETVTWLIPTHKLDLPDGLFDHIKATKNITILTSTSVKAIVGTVAVEHVVVLTSGQEKQIPTQLVLLHPAAYHAPLDYLTGSNVQLSSRGHPLVSPTLETNVRGIFACGDLLCGTPQIPSITMAQGIIAAQSADLLLDTWKPQSHKSQSAPSVNPQATQASAATHG